MYLWTAKSEAIISNAMVKLLARGHSCPRPFARSHPCRTQRIAPRFAKRAGSEAEGHFASYISVLRQGAGHCAERGGGCFQVRCRLGSLARSEIFQAKQAHATSLGKAILKLMDPIGYETSTGEQYYPRLMLDRVWKTFPGNVIEVFFKGHWCLNIA